VISWFLTYLVILCIKARAARNDTAQLRGDIVSLIGESSATGFDGGGVAPQAKVGRLALPAKRY